MKTYRQQQMEKAQIRSNEMTKTIRTDYKGNDTIEMTAVEIEHGLGINKVEYFVDYYKNGTDNTVTRVFKTEAAAHEFMTGLL